MCCTETTIIGPSIKYEQNNEISVLNFDYSFLVVYTLYSITFEKIVSKNNENMYCFDYYNLN